MKYISIILLLAASFTLKAEDSSVYLYVFFHDDNSNGERFRTVMQDMNECLKVLNNSKLPSPDKPAGDYEVMGAMWCGRDIERQYGSTWWKDQTEKSDK